MSHRIHEPAPAQLPGSAHMHRKEVQHGNGRQRRPGKPTAGRGSAAEGCRIQERPGHCHRILLPGSWEEYLRVLSRSTRKRILLKMRRLQELGAQVQPVHVCGYGVQTFGALHTAQWAEKGYSYLAAVNPDGLRHLSPGLVLTLWRIQAAIQDGYRCYDLLRGDEPCPCPGPGCPPPAGKASAPGTGADQDPHTERRARPLSRTPGGAMMAP